MVASWNANHPSVNDTVEWMMSLTSTNWRAVTCLQEVEYTPMNTAIDGYNFCKVSDEAHCAILIPSELSSAVTWDSSSEPAFKQFKWSSAVSFKGILGIVSGYFPHAKRPEYFLVAMDEARGSMGELRKRKMKVIVLGGDLNSQMPKHIPKITGASCYGVQDPSHDLRTDMMCALMKDFNMCCANTFMSDPAHTRKDWSSPPIFYQLDYLCITHGASLMDLSVHNSEATWRSDHFPVAGTIRLDERLRGAAFRNTKTGWKPIEKKGYNDFKNLVMGSVNCDGPPATINEVQCIVETAAEWIPHTCRQERIRELKKAPHKLIEARERRRVAPGPLLPPCTCDS